MQICKKEWGNRDDSLVETGIAGKGVVIMTIGRVELQGQVTRAQDFTTIKHNEDNKTVVDHSNFQNQFEHQVETKAHQVTQGDQTENRGKRFDAKEEGNGNYAGDGGRKRRKEEKDGKVVLKGQGSFDIKI